MNKIFKVIYSKTRHCYVVVSELAKSHCKTTQSHTVRSKTALTAAVLLALGTFSVASVFMPMTAEAATTKTDGSNFVGVERTDGLLDDNKYDNYGGKGANGADSITLGLRAKAGEGTITIGDRNAGASLGSVYVGQGDIANPKIDTGGWVTSIGYNSDATGYGSIALGSNAVAKNSYAKDSKGESLDLNPNFRLNSKPDIQRASVAIGYGANADNGNIAIGSYSDASTDLRTAKTPDGEEIKSYLTDKKADSYVSVGKTGALRRISNVADGAADSDAATIAQLKKAVEETDASKKANIDASNIGENLKKADGKTAADSSDKKNNKDAWGNAIGTGKVEKNNGQLVTGGTVYSALENQKKDLSVHAGWGISVAKDKDGNAISLNRNLGRDAYTKDKAVLKADENKSALVIGGRVNPGDATGGQTAEKDYGALGQDSVTVGGADNTVRENGDAAVVVGGVSNTASAQYSTVIGGSANDALGNQSSVFGGHDNDAHGKYSTASGGSMNRAYGAAASVFGGGVNSALGDSSVAVGGLQSTVNGTFAVGIAGGSTNADYALAAGNGANVTVENGTAIGYQATTDEAGTIAFGHDAGDAYYSSTTWPQKATKQNGKYYDANNKEISKAKYDALKNSDGTWNDYSKTPTVAEKTYDKAAYNRLVKVADGQDAHDVVVMEQLDKAKSELSDSLSVNAGWGINIKDETTQNADGTETTTKNVISLNRNLGTNYGNALEAYGGKGKVTFEAAGENSLILGGGARNTDWDYKDKDRALGAFQKDSVLVGGLNNTVSKPTDTTDEQEGSVIVGGTDNTASGYYTLINGGQSNIANGYNSVVSGGYKNTASSSYSVATGGVSNEASGWASVVIGGDANKSTSSESIVAGGYQNQSTGINSSVFGGLLDEASGFGATAVGGNGTKAIGEAATGLGGQANFAIGSKSTIAGGGGNVTVGETSSAFGGMQNLVTGAAASAFGGYKSTVNGLFSTGVAGGSTDDEAVLSLAAGSQAIVTNSGVEKTYLTGEEYYQIATDINNGKKDLTGFYIYDPTYDGSAPGDMRYIHYDKPSTAIGYQATADTPGVVAFGHDKGDVSSVKKTWKQKATKEGNDVDGYKYYDANHKEITQEDYFKLANGDGTWNDYTQNPIGTETKTYDSAYYNRLVKVADGIDDHDVVVMEQLKQYAEKDASNIGNNIKVYKTDANGNVQLDKDKKPIEETDATTTAQNGSKDDWGQALGAGTFTTGTSDKATDASTSDQLVTGKTLYDYDKPTGSQNYVNVKNTTGQNLSALDAQVKANADTLNDKTHNIKYYSVDENLPKIDGYTNEGNDGAKGMGSIAAGFNTHADGIASTVAGSYSGVINSKTDGLDLRGATALSYGTFNINQNTDATKEHSGVANSIIGQVNMTKDSNAAIIYGAGNIVTDSYRPIDETKAAAILGSVNDPAKLGEAMKDAVKTSGGQVMVMGGGNTVDKAYMSQVVGVGNTVKGNQVQNTKSEWVTDTSDTAIKDYDAEKSSQYNYVDGFNNEVINGKHDYVIGANNKLSGDSYDNDTVRPIKRSNKSNIVIGDNHTLTREQNTVIIGSSDTENTQTKARDAVIIGHNANATNDKEDANADNAVAIGRSAKATGGNAVTIGVNTSAGAESITIGSESSADPGSNIAIGRSVQVYGYKITNAVALGVNTEALVSDGVAIGSESQATVKGNSAEGYDPVTGKDSTDKTATWKATKAAVSIGTADGTVTRQINGVAAGTNDTDAVNVAQLKKLEGMKANVDATNIGKNLKGTDGKTVSDEDITANEKAWGAALGTGDIATPKDMLVTDKAIHDELRPTTDGTYVKGSQTTAENLSKLDAQVKTNADGISTNTTNITKNAGDITNLKNLSNITDEGRTVIKNLSKDAVKVAAGDRISVAEEVDSTTGNKTYTVSAKNDGQVAAGDQNLVSGDTVNTAINNAITNAGTATDTKLAGKANVDATNIGKNLKGADGNTVSDEDITANEKAWGAALGTGDIATPKDMLVTDKAIHDELRPTTDGTYVKGSQTTAENLSKLDAQVKTNADGISTNTTNITKNAGDITNLKNLSNITDEGRTVIKNLSKDAVKVAAGDRISVAEEVDSTTGNKTYTVSAKNDGQVAAGDQNLVSGDTVNTAINNAITSAGTATDTKLAGKANVDASNIGANLKDAGGKAASTEEITANENAWGTAIGTGEIAENNGQLVTGGKVYDALHGGLTDITVGKPGKDGKDGSIGLVGPTGPKGTDGKNAYATTIIKTEKGTDGVDGKNGEDGITRIVYNDTNNPANKHTVATLDDGMKYAGDTGAVANVKLDHQLKLSGTTFNDTKKYNADDWTSDNIAVVSSAVDKDGNAAMNLKLAKDLKNLNSSEYKTADGDTTYTTIINSKGLTITGGPSITNTGIDAGGKVITNIGTGIVKDNSGKITDASKTNAANIGDVQTIVNDAKKDLTDGKNGLNSKANVDASNIGSNITVAPIYQKDEKGQDVIGQDGQKVIDQKATEDAEKAARTANENAWGKAIGTGKMEQGNGQLVTGDTVYNEVRPKKDGNYVQKDKTTGENLSALDSKIGKLDETKKYNYIDSGKDVSISDNLTKLDTQVKNNADAIQKNSESIQNITNNVKNLSDNAVQYDKDSNKTKVTLGGGEGGTTITNVKDGALNDKSTDAVNGKQLYNEQQAREAADKAITEKVTNNTSEITKIKKGDFTDASKTVIKNLAKDAVQVKAGDRIKVAEATDEKTGNKTYTISANNDGKVEKNNGNLISGDTLYNEVRPTEDGSYVKKDKTTHENLSALDKGLKTTSDLIHTNDKGDTIQIGGNSTATKIDVSGKDANGNTTGRVITGVISDASNPNSAANVGYVNSVMNNTYGRLDRNINRAAAGSNALAALHPLDYDPADKASFAVGYGHYRNANAAAIGAFYYPNANTMVNVGVSVGNGDPGINAGVSFKLGQGSAYNGVSKAEMAQTIHDQAAEISTIKANDAAKDKRIDALEKENQEMKKQIQEILARLNG